MPAIHVPTPNFFSANKDGTVSVTFGTTSLGGHIIGMSGCDIDIRTTKTYLLPDAFLCDLNEDCVMDDCEIGGACLLQLINLMDSDKKIREQIREHMPLLLISSNHSSVWLLNAALERMQKEDELDGR